MKVIVFEFGWQLTVMLYDDCEGKGNWWTAELKGESAIDNVGILLENLC